MQAETDHDPDPEAPPSPAVGPSKPRLLSILGPGLITGAADDDPERHRDLLPGRRAVRLWPAVDHALHLSADGGGAEISARIGRVTGRGIAGNLREHYRLAAARASCRCCSSPTPSTSAPISARWADALSLLIGGPHLLYVVLFGGSRSCCRCSCRTPATSRVLKWLTLALFAYVGGAVHGARAAGVRR